MTSLPRSLASRLLTLLALVLLAGCDLFGFPEADEQSSIFEAVLTDADGATKALVGTANYSVVRLQREGSDETITVIQVTLQDPTLNFTPVIEITLPEALSRGEAFTARFAQQRELQSVTYAPDGICQAVLRADGGTLVVDQKKEDFLEADFDLEMETLTPYTPDPTFGCGLEDPIVTENPVRVTLEGSLSARRRR